MPGFLTRGAIVRKRGFTLIEMMIVVAIIGIVSSYALPNYMSQIVARQIQEGIGLASAYQPDIVKYYRLNGRFPSDNETLGIPPADKILGNYVTRVSVDDGVVNITFGHYVNKVVENKVLSLRPLIVTGSPQSPIGWSCGYREPPPGMTGIGVNQSTALRSMVPLDCR